MKKYPKLSLIILTILFPFQLLFGQDGAQLFKAKCNTCHMVDKNSTGPLLKGVKQKWTDAGEAEMLYEWVKNPQTLIASGKSKMANDIKGYSGSDMSPQVVSNEEVDAILNYIDTYTPPPPPTTTPGDSKEPLVALPDYDGNLSLFYWLSTSMFLLLLAIIIISTSMTSFVKSDYFKRKLQENSTKNNSGVNTIIVLIGFIGLMAVSNQSLALTFMDTGEAEKGMPWLLVENMDIYFMIGINVILLGILLYIRRMFNDMMAMARPPKEVEVSVAAVRIKKLNEILTDTVAVEEEHTILMHHEYDGIRELDNNLPPWWVWGFYATIIFAVVYLLNYHVFRTGDLQIEEYNKEMVEAKIEIDAYLSKMAMNVDETNATLLTDGESISTGKAIFEANCTACHNQKAEGNIGPNLTDDHWIYGPDIKDLFKTIKKGTPNGMPEHASKLNPIQLQKVSSFILSLPYTKGKEPEGKEYK